MPDFLAECNAQGVSPKEFRQTFCTRCRNPECQLAEWGTSLMDKRVVLQEQRLLHPQQADPRLPKYAHIQAADFQDMMREALRLEIADRRGDWEVPEIDTDGRVEVASTETTQAVDNAVRNLARAQGQSEPPLPEPVDTEAAAKELLADMDKWEGLSVEELEQVVAAERKALEESEEDSGAVTSSPIGDPEPREERRPPEPAVTSSLRSPPHPMGKRSPPTPPKAANTSVPAGGIMVGGGSTPKAEPAPDPWAPPPGAGAPVKKVPPGAKIRMGLGVPEPEEKS